jgi:hypothetical protein
VAYTWAKVYIEILEDHKMGLLPDHLWRRVIEMILLAKKLDKDGFLPGMMEMSWILRISTEQLEAELQEIESKTKTDTDPGIVHLVDGNWFLTNFIKRQTAESDAERAKSYRKRNVTHNRHESVTNRDIDLRLDSDIDIDKTETVGAKTAPAKPSKPRTSKKQSDERTATAAIQACYQTAKRFPPIELYDKLIGALGNAPEIEKLTACRAQWLERGYNPNAWTWATEWYTGGIPSRNGDKSRADKFALADQMTRERLAQHGESW